MLALELVLKWQVDNVHVRAASSAESDRREWRQIFTARAVFPLLMTHSWTTRSGTGEPWSLGKEIRFRLQNAAYRRAADLARAARHDLRMCEEHFARPVTNLWLGSMPELGETRESVRFTDEDLDDWVDRTDAMSVVSDDEDDVDVAFH
jgi:hypothetical protein